MPSSLAHITTHFFSIPVAQDESPYVSARPAQELTSSSALAVGAASSHRSTGGPLDGSRRLMSLRRGGGVSGGAGGGGGGHVHSTAAAQRPSSAASSTVALTPILSPTSPIALRRPTFSVSPCSSSGGPRSWAALTRTRRALEDSSFAFPSSPRMLGLGIGADAFVSEVAMHSYQAPGTESRSWLMSAGPGVTGREAACGTATMVSSQYPSPSTAAVSHYGVPCNASGPMSPTGRVLSNRFAPTGTAVGPDPNKDGVSTAASGKRGCDSVGGRGGGPHCSFTDPIATLVTEADGDFLVQPLIHFLEGEETLRYVAGLLDRSRLSEVASAADAVKHNAAAGGPSVVPSEKSNQAVAVQRDYVLNAQQSKSLHALMRSCSGTPDMPRHRGAPAPKFSSPSSASWGAMDSVVAGNGMRMSAQSLSAFPAPPLVSHLRSSSNEEAAATKKCSLTNTGSVVTDSKASTAAAAAPSLYQMASASSLIDTDVKAGKDQSAARQSSKVSHRSLEGIGSGASVATEGVSRVTPEVSKLEEKSSEVHHAADAGANDTAVASASPPIDVEGLHLALRHNVFANYRTVPVHYAKRSYEQLPVRYRAGFDAIAAEVRAQQQQRDHQQGGTGAANSSAEVTNGQAVTSVGGGGASDTGGGATVGHPCRRLSEGSSVGIAAATPRAPGSVADSYRDPIIHTGMSFYGTGGCCSVLPVTTSLSGSIAAASTAATPAVSPTWLTGGGGMRRDMSAFPSFFSRAMEERGVAAMASAATVTTSPTERGAAAGARVSSLRSSSPASAVTPTSAAMYDTAPGTGLSSRVALLQHVHHTIQAFIARGEREVALHFIMATAPYRFSGIADGDRVLAFFNQIRLFLPSPRFGIVMLAMEAWRSLYRPCVGAGAADCTHMTEELLALMETYLCHGRTYAEYVSGLLMLRAVLAFAMENSTMGSTTAAVLLQHQSLLRSRLPTFLLAVWLILMELYTIDDTVRPPRRVLRDLAANAMQDLFTVALELHMTLPVQNIVANAVNVFFAGPQPQPQLMLCSPSITLHDGAMASMEVGHRGGLEASRQSPRSVANAAATGASFTPSIYPHATDTIGKSANGDAVTFHLRTSEVVAGATAGVGGTGDGAARAETPRSPSPCRPTRTVAKESLMDTANTAASVPLFCDSTENKSLAPPTRASTSASPAPQLPTVSYRALTKSVWGSVKRAARRLVDRELVSSRSSVLDTPATAANRCSAAKAVDTARDAFSGAPGRSLGPSASEPPGGAVSARRLAANRRPSPPLLIEVLDDVFCESIGADSSEQPSTVMRCTGGGPPPAPSFTAVTGADSHWFMQSSHPRSPQALLRAAVMSARAGVGRGTIPSPLHGLRQSPAALSPLLRHGSWAQRRQQQRSFNLSAAAATTLGPESVSAFSDALWGNVPLDGAVFSRCALWTLSLTRALQAAGRPQTLEATVAASTLTLGAFLCAWRIAGGSDETACDEVRQPVSQNLTAPATTDQPSRAANSAEASTIPLGQGPLPLHFVRASKGAAVGNADPLTEGVILPLLTPESIRDAEGLGLSACRGDSPAEAFPLPHSSLATGASTAMSNGASAASRVTGGHPRGESKASSSLTSTTMTTFARCTEVPPRRARLLASTTVDVDPEWHSVESAATNMYIPLVTGATSPIVTAAGAATQVTGNEVPAAAPALVSETATQISLSPLLRPRTTSPTPVEQGAVVNAAVHDNDCGSTREACAIPHTASRAAVTAASLPDGTHQQRMSSTCGNTRGKMGVTAQAAASRPQGERLAAIPTSRAESCGVRAPGTATAGVVETPTSRLDFFLPSWVASRVMERCVHPCWDTISLPTPSPMPGHVNAAGGPTSSVAVTKEVEVLLTSLVPLLSQYYLDAFSASTVTAATQVLVNRAIQAVKSVSRGVCDCSSISSSSSLGAHGRGGVRADVTVPPPSATPVPSSTTPLHPHMDDLLNGAVSLAASPRAAAPATTAATKATKATTATAAPSSAPLTPPLPACEEEKDNPHVDGTELLNAILFIITLAKRYPAVYETIVREKLYPLLHFTLLLHNSAIEEPQLWLSVPLSSATAAACFSIGTQATAVKSLAPPPPQQQYKPLSVSPANAAAVESEAVIQRMRLFTSRTMYQRIALPALVLLSQNMPDDACAQRCYPLVARLAQLGLRRPFSMASVTTALCIGAVYPSLSRVCQSKLIRAMAVVLSTPDDGLINEDDEGDYGAVDAPVTTALRKTVEKRVRPSRHSRKGPPPRLPEEERRNTRGEEAIAGKSIGPTGGVVASPTYSSTPAAVGAASHGSLPWSPSRGATLTTAAAAAGSSAYPMWRSQLNLQLFLPFFPTDLGPLHLCTPALRAAQQRQAVQTRLIKHQCFRAMSLFNSTWEGATSFFLEVCLPYFRHPDAQMRLECVQCCMHWLLSDCWHTTGQTPSHRQAVAAAVSGGGMAAASSTALASFRGSVTAAVTRAPVRDPRTTANSENDTEGGACRTAASQCPITLSAPPTTQAGRVCMSSHGSSSRVSEGFRSRCCSVFGPRAAPAAATAPAVVVVPAALSSATTSSSAMSIPTVQHHGCTHVNALREVVHHLVELAVCDPEPLVRKCALESLSPATYPFLYPHEPAVHQLFTVLWDSHMPNRSKAAQLLCDLAPLNPSFIFPRLRQVLAQYTDDLMSSIERFEVPSAGGKSASAPLLLSSPRCIHEDALFVLSQVASRLKHSTYLYLPQLLAIVSAVLRSTSSARGSVLQALHFLVALREDSTEEQSTLFAPFFDLVAQQLIDDDGDTSRLLATVEALQSLLRQFTGSPHSSPQTLPMVEECLHSLLYRKPSVRAEFAMAVLQLLATISSIEPLDAEAAPRPPALLRRPRNRYALPLLSSLAGVLGRGRAARSRWLERDEKADSAAQALAQLQKADRFTPFTARTWCDAVLRALMRTASEYMNGTMSQTQGGLCACLDAIMNILTNTVAVYHLEIYLPTVLTLVIDLLEKGQTRSRSIATTYRTSARKSHSRTTTTAAAAAAAAAAGPTERSQTNDSTEAIRQLFLGRLLDLVSVAGRRIGSMYPLLNVFLRRSWKTLQSRGLVQCCKVLDALCWAVPDLLQKDCDVWVSSLLEALIEYDTLVVTHRRAHEGAPGSVPVVANASMGATATSTAAGVSVVLAEGRGDAPAASHSTLKNLSAPADRASLAQHGSVTADAGDNISGGPEKTHTPVVSLPHAAGADRDEVASWEQQLKLVYQALTLCLTSLQPLVSHLGKRLVALGLSECLKSSHVPRSETARRGVLPTATAAPPDGRAKHSGGLDKASGATLDASTRLLLRSSKPATVSPTTLAVFDLMADPHEELISFLNACVCTPLLEYMVHCNLSTISMRLVKNLLSRLESLSAVHEEALQRLLGAMGEHSASLQSQSKVSTDQSCLTGTASSSATPPTGSVCSLAAPARAQLEARLCEVREQLYVQQAQQCDEGNGMAQVSGCVSSASPSLAVFNASPRSANEALWFRNAAISRMWVQSADSATTVRRFFPFHAVQTSWETEGEMHLLGCLLVSAAWRHPPSTPAFAATLHTYVAHRFGPDSVAVAYVRCVCSSFYDLCMPLGSAHDGEGAAQGAAQQQQQQQRCHRQGVAPTSSYSDIATESDTSPTAAARSVTMSGSGVCDAAVPLAQESSADVILRNSSSFLTQTPPVMTPGERNTTASLKGTGVVSRSSGMGSRVVSWEDDPSAPTIVGAEGASVASSAAAIAFAGSLGARASRRRAPRNSAAASSSSVLTAAATVCKTNKDGMSFARPLAVYPSTEHLDSSSDGRRSADVNTAVRGSDNEEDQDSGGRIWTNSYNPRFTRTTTSSNSSALPQPPPTGYQQPYSHQAQQQGYPLLTRTATSTPFCNPNSLTHTITAPSTNGADTPPLTAHHYIATAATRPIPVVAGGDIGGGSGGVRGVVFGSDPENYVSASALLVFSGPRSTSTSGSSFYPGSLFGDAVVAEGRASGDGRIRKGVVYNCSQGQYLHTLSRAGSRGTPGDVEPMNGGGRGDVVQRANAMAGSGAEVAFTPPTSPSFQPRHTLPFSGEQSHCLYPISSTALPSVILAQQPNAIRTIAAEVPTVGSFTNAPLYRRPGLLGLPPALLTPASGDEGGAAETAHRGPGGMPFRGRFSPIAASDSADGMASLSISTMPPSVVGEGCCGPVFPFAGDALHDTEVVRQPHPQKTSPPLFSETSFSPGGNVFDARGQVRFITRSPAFPSLKTETRTDAGAVPASSLMIGHMNHECPMRLSGGTGSAAAANEKVGEAVADPDSTSPWVAGEVSEACAAVASAHEAGGVAHENSLIAYFELHRSLAGHGWRSWWEQFCLFLLQCSQDYSVQACEPFARQHNIAFSYSELLPLALLSALPSCTVAGLVAWLQALRDFYTYHTDPHAPVPQQVASGVACMAHGLRLYRHQFFPPEVVSRVVDVWLPDRVVADLANRSLNPPLRILYLEQDMARSFSWECTALLMAAADDVASAVERMLFVQDPRFQQWLSAVAAPASGIPPRDTAADDSPVRWRHSSKATRSAAAVPESSSPMAMEVLPPSALELLGFYRAAALEYVRLYAAQQMNERGDDSGGATTEEGDCAQGGSSSPFKGMPTRHCSSAAASEFIVGAMRCYICLYDFESVLQLWESVKGNGNADATASMESALLPGAACGVSSTGNGNSAAVRRDAPGVYSRALSSDTAHYVMMSAQALARWDYVQEAVHYALGCDSADGLHWTSGVPRVVAQTPMSKSGETLTDSHESPHPSESLRSWAADVEQEGCPQQYREGVFSSNFASATANASAHWAMDHTRKSLLHWQMEVFAGAALVAAHDYSGARRALTALRSGLRDSYAVFHTNNDRVKLEWSSIFQQLSELEEGMYALEQLPTSQEEAATLSTGLESGGASVGWSGPGSLALDREINGKLFSEATVRRLRNIACRPVSATTTILQRFMIIAVRSAIAPVAWQLDNVLAVGEMLEKAGQPMRAVQVLHHYAHLPAVASSFTTVAVEFKQQLDLDMLRRLIRNLPSEEDLCEVHACVQTALRHDLWLTRRDATRPMTAVSPISSLTASIYAEATLLPPLGNEQAMSGAAPLGAMLTTQELGSSLTQYQVDLLLLILACRRRLADVLLHHTPPDTQRSPGRTVVVSGPERSLMSNTVQHPANARASAIGVEKPLHGGEADAVETERAFDTEPSSPLSLSMTRELRGSPTTAAFPLYPTRPGPASAAAKHNSGVRERLCRDSTESRCLRGNRLSPPQEQPAKRDGAVRATEEEVDVGSEGNESMESLTGKTAMFAEYYLLEHAVAVTSYVPSVWREFGLVLFDVCLAIHAEWKSTDDDETKNNFLAQSAKAIQGLQLAGQLWRSRSESVFSRGIGPFPATMLRRTAHARTVLPSAHMVLKALHLATMCEVVVEDDARAALARSTATATASGAAMGLPGLPSFPLSPSAPGSSSLGVGIEIAEDAAEVAVAVASGAEDCNSGGGSGGSTVSRLTTSRSSDVSQCTQKPQAGAHDTQLTEGTGEENATDPLTAKGSTNTPVRPLYSTSPPKLTTTVTVTEQKGGLACLDFSAASYVQWAAVAPFLLAAATRHRSLYTAVRDMCVRSRDMLRQLIFPLVAMFEHEYENMFIQRAGYSQYNRAAESAEASGKTAAAAAAAAAAAVTVSRSSPRTFSGAVCEGREGAGQRQPPRNSHASAQAWGNEGAVDGVSRLSSMPSTEAPSPSEYQGEPGQAASDAGLIALRAASVSATDFADVRHRERRRHSSTTLETPSLSARSSIFDRDAAPLAGATGPYTGPVSQHFASPLEPPPGEVLRGVRSSLLADVAAASPAHRRLIQEAMQVRDFVEGLWQVPVTARQGPESLRTRMMRESSDPPSLAPSGGAEGAPTSRPRRDVAPKGPRLRGIAGDKRVASGFVDTDDAAVMHGETELCLDGFCPLPAPLWLLPSVFGAGATPVDDGGKGGRVSTGDREGARVGKAHVRGGVADSERAAGGRHEGIQPPGAASSSFASVTGATGRRVTQVEGDGGGVPGQPRTSEIHLRASAATAESHSNMRGTPASVDCFARATVPTIMHVRRYAVPNPAPHHRCEEVIVVMLSDGLMCRFRHAAPVPSTTSREAVGECDPLHDAVALLDVPQSELQKRASASTGAGATNTTATSEGRTAPYRYVIPYALMEQVTSLLIGYIPLGHLQRPFVLPLSLETYMTMLPEHGSSSPLGAAIAATVQPSYSQGQRHGVELVADTSSSSSAAALRTAAQLLSTSSNVTSAPPSLYHLMDDYTVHLRTLEMALAAQEAVATYPTLDLDALQIAAVTGRRPGLSADSTYPFNWAYGYPVSAPPTDEAAAALTNSRKYRDLVQRRRVNEERFDKLTAAAYDDGSIGPLIAFLEALLAARPPPPPPPAAAAAAPLAQTDAAEIHTSATKSPAPSSFLPAPQPFRSPEETFALQQDLYAYAATLPRTEAHLRRVLEALSSAVAEASDETPAKESSTSSSLSPLAPGATPVLNSKNGCHGRRLPITAARSPNLSARELQACRLALFRQESARFRLALSDAFNADSGNASHWFDARRTYAKELSEWSVLEYLLDIPKRECGTVLVNTYDGHVAVHALGRYCLQPPPQFSGEVRAKETASCPADIASLTTTPFPTRDATLFRLTPVLVAGLPNQSPHAAFQYHASSVLHDIFQYARDLTGISTYGVDSLAAFASHAVVPNPASPSSRTSSIEAPLSAWPCTDISGAASVVAIAEGTVELGTAVASPHASDKTAVAATRRVRQTSQPIGSSVDVPRAGVPTALCSAFRVLPGRRSAQRPTASPLGNAVDVATMPPPPRCFDSSSLRFKLSYDALLVLRDEVERSGRESILRLLRRQREDMQRQWLHMTPGSPSHKDDEYISLRTAESATGHGAAEKKTHRNVASAAFDSADDSDRCHKGVPRLLSAFDLVASMIAAATDEERLLGVDGVCPHTWRRWAPHW